MEMHDVCTTYFGELLHSGSVFFGAVVHKWMEATRYFLCPVAPFRQKRSSVDGYSIWYIIFFNSSDIALHIHDSIWFCPMQQALVKSRRGRLFFCNLSYRRSVHITCRFIVKVGVV